MLNFTTTTVLRSGVARCGLQPVLLRSSSCPYSTFAASPFGIRPKPQEPPPRAVSLATGRKPLTTASRRSVSTTGAQQDAAAAAAASGSPTAAYAEGAPLDWNSFFRLRKTRRRWQLAFSVTTGAAGGTAGALFLSSGVADPVVNTIPLDPFVTLGLMTFGFAALGWLIGPSLGSAIFYALNRKYQAQMTVVGCLPFVPQALLTRDDMLTRIWRVEGNSVLRTRQEEPR